MHADGRWSRPQSGSAPHPVSRLARVRTHDAVITPGSATGMEFGGRPADPSRMEPQLGNAELAEAVRRLVARVTALEQVIMARPPQASETAGVERTTYFLVEPRPALGTSELVSR